MTGWVRSKAPGLSEPPSVTANLNRTENKKQNQRLEATLENIKLSLSKEIVNCSFRCIIVMTEFKTKAIQTSLGTFKHYQTYSGIIRAYSGIFIILYYPDVFTNVPYLEP